jgi:hypothetical protein
MIVDQRIAEWLASGDTGASSKAIMLWLSAKVKDSAWGASTPSDVSDLGRCLRLLDRIPEFKARMGEMAEAGGEWPTFAKRWDEMEAMYRSEAGGRAPKTYKLMKEVEAEARQAAGTASQYVSMGAGCEIRFPGRATR